MEEVEQYYAAAARQTSPASTAAGSFHLIANRAVIVFNYSVNE
jgi:hypothetical protein